MQTMPVVIGRETHTLKNRQYILALTKLEQSTPLTLLFVIQPDISLGQSLSCLRERSVSAVDKDMYTWVSSAYK